MEFETLAYSEALNGSRERTVANGSRTRGRRRPTLSARLAVGEVRENTPSTVGRTPATRALAPRMWASVGAGREGA